MRHEAEIRERYLRDDLPTRLGGLAANLARIRSFSSNPENLAAIETLLVESRRFIEWIASDTPPEKRASLLELESELARWSQHLTGVPFEAAERESLAEFARDWSDRVLAMSGLLDETSGSDSPGT